MSTEAYYWIAINGSSVALSPYALPVTVNVNPIPQLLVGFRTLEAAREQHDFLLTAPIGKVRQRIDSLLAKASRGGEIVTVRPTNPPQPPQSETIWEITGGK